MPRATARPAETPSTAPKPTPPKRNTDSMFLALDETGLKLNVLMYGKEGTGKTTAAAHAANQGKILVINAEGGLKAGALRRAGVNTANIATWPTPGVPINHDTMDELYRKVRSDLLDDPDSWYAVVIDSVTDVLETMTRNVADARVTKQRGFGKVIDQYAAFETDRGDYGVMGSQIKDLIRKFRDLPCHLIITALERRDVDEDTGLTTYGPAASPGVQKDLLAYVDLVLYMRAADPEEGKPYRALTKPTRRYRAKDRLNALPRILAEPSFDRILGYAEEELDAESDPIQDTATQAEDEPTRNTDKKEN